MALVAIPTTFLLIWPIASVTDVSVIVQYLVGLIGLGIAIDYALLMVVRWREERLRPDVTNETAVKNAMQHAGSSVVFSGTTVAISLLALLVLPVPFLRSIGIAGLLIAIVSVCCRRHAPAGRPRDRRAEARLAAQPTRRARQPSLVGLGSPHRPLPLGVGADVDGSSRRTRAGGILDPARNPRAESLAYGGPAQAGLEKLQDAGIGTGPLSPFDALVRSGDPGAAATSIAGVDGVWNAVAPADWRRDGTAVVVVIPTADGNSAAGRATLDRIRATSLPGEVMIGGKAAQGADFVDAVYGNFPLMLGADLVRVTFVLLVRAFRSLLLAVKAVALNLLTRCGHLRPDRAGLAERATRPSRSGASRRPARSTTRYPSWSSHSCSDSRWTIRSSSSAGCAKTTTAAPRPGKPRWTASAALAAWSRAPP